jgi:hypothetical protein
MSFATQRCQKYQESEDPGFHSKSPIVRQRPAGRDLENTITQTYLHMSANAQRVSDQGFRAVDQNVRDVQSFRDPSTRHTFELSNQYGHAWLNGANEYVMSNDPNFNPNSQLPGNWNQLQPVPP